MILSPPLTELDVRELKLGQTVSIDGVIYTARDEVHLRALQYHKEERKLPVDFRDSVLFHSGPLVKKEGEGWKLIAAGPTTSSRMNSLEPDFIETFGVRAIVGKGGMSQPTVEAMKRWGCVYLALTGGAAVIGASGIKRIKGVEWLDLGPPEAIWILEVKDFGPLTVAIDAHGNSLYGQVRERVEKNLEEIKRSL